jgi:hypothetical protein
MILFAARNGDTAHAPDNTLGAPAPAYKKRIVPRTQATFRAANGDVWGGEISPWHERVIILLVMSPWPRFSPVF